MSITDFLIGLTLVNAIPHFVLGVWKGRILSGLGFGPTANILYALFNFAVSITLFTTRYGVAGLADHGIFAGGLFIVVIYFITGKFLYTRFHQRHFAQP